ncbi:MAG: trimeric intracellular cation channel family protein [Planctomycetota bacterium]|jgi:uncharacterized membrane protein YeiH|nr:MAG: trimeric intracellular cation channel family protein [Planctomycetota bacterium]
MMLVIEVLAVISGAVFGVLLARRKGMDFVGVFSVAFMTAFGGGTLRDVLLDRHPLFWIQYSWYPVIVFVVAAVVSLIPKIPKSAERLLHFPDAMGLGLFSILGTEIALEQGVSPFVAVLFGVMTGTFGGVIGDIACNEVPNLFRPATPLYATCAFVGGWILLVCKMMPLPDSADFLISAAVVVVLRLLALKFNIGLRAVE